MMIAVPGLIMATIITGAAEYVALFSRGEGITLRHFQPEFGGMTRIIKREVKAVRQSFAC